MFTRQSWLNNPWLRVLQHLLFWALSFLVFSHLFAVGTKPEKIDYIYTGLFHLFILPPVYIHLEILLPWLRVNTFWIRYIVLTIAAITIFAWINFSFFSDWSNVILPQYFFISYFTFIQVVTFFVIYLIITSLIKLSKSWFLVNAMQKELLETERLRSIREKELLEMEARALRAQMNPHFIFNCLNSIKSLMQEEENDKGVIYLTTFSKLIRTLFNNADKKEITLYDEIETCRLYLQLEAMRFDSKFSYSINVEEGIDLKSAFVPALIIQPFIENAIWHGIVPKGSGGNVLLKVSKNNGTIEVVIDDDGIGREASMLNKAKSSVAHQSKGVNLTQSRLELDNLLQQRQAKLIIVDKQHTNGVASGTKVILTLKAPE